MSYQTIYNQLRAAGLTEAGALAMLGNWDCESNCEANRVQGDFSPYRTQSKQYTTDVDYGMIPKQQFQNDQRGYGLAQWTYPTRKADLYDFCKKLGSSIGNETTQVKFALEELKNDFPSLLNELKTSNDLEQCVTDVCYKFENPAVKNTGQRLDAAQRIAKMIDLNGGGDTPDPDPEPTPEPDEHKLVLRTIDCHCSDWPEVTLLGAALYCRKYLSFAPGYWDDEMTDAVKEFQRDHELTADGVVGPKTWDKLLQRG